MPFHIFCIQQISSIVFWRKRAHQSKPPGAERPVVHIDPATGKANGPHKKKLRTYLGIVARDKVDLTYENWKDVPTSQKDLIWEAIQAEFEIPEASNSRTKRKLLQIVSERWRQFKSDLTRKWVLAANQDSVDDTACEKYDISKEKWAQFCQTRRDPSWEVCTLPFKYAEKGTGHPETEHCVCVAGVGVTIKQYFGSAARMSRSSSSLPPEELQQLTQQIRDQLEKSITEKGLALPPEPLIGPSGPRVSTKGSCVDPSGYDPETGDSDRCGLHIEANPDRLVVLGRVYEGSTVVHKTPFLSGQVKMVVSLAKPPQKSNPEVNDPQYLMTLTIPELFSRPYQVTWDATVFGVFNPDLLLYIKQEDLSEISHGGQCLSILVLQLWIFMRAGNFDIYGFLEPQSIQSSGQSQFETESYIKSWMHSSKRDVYLGAYLNGGHWQMVVIVPKEHLVVWFCSLHNRPDNYLKGIINSALKGLDDASQPKSKAPARWIIVKYFNDLRPLEPERLKALRIQWAQYYLRVRAQSRI
ncbi:hypothetical protein GmHk_12G034909 [Glycine max]|nr:hypothetical protein GmHk_12G034909 [Glycine max]